MKKLNFLVAALIGLFLQGCATEVPLFKDDEVIKNNEAVIVFNVYTKDSHVDRGIFSSDLVYLYMNSKLSGQSVQDFSKQNYLSVSEVRQKYIVAKIPAGKYYLIKFDTRYSYSSGNYIHTITLSSPEHNAKNTPLEFNVVAGEVKYLGDIEVKRAAKAGNRFVPLYTIHNQFSEAKKFISKKYPNISNRLTQSLIQKTVPQILIEQKYSAVDVSNLLNEVKDAK